MFILIEIVFLCLYYMFRPVLRPSSDISIQQSYKESKQSNPITGLNRPRGFQEVEAARFQKKKKSAHEGNKVVSHKHRPPLRPGNIPGSYFC